MHFFLLYDPIQFYETIHNQKIASSQGDQETRLKRRT